MNLPGLVYTSPNKFSWKERLLLHLLPPIVATLLKLLLRSCRWEIRNPLEQHEAFSRHGGKVIIALWHEATGMAVFQYRNTGWHTLASYSYDGELGARIVRRFGLMSARGSSSRGGSQALQQLELAAQHITVGFTVDGPRGPRREAKNGVAILAARTGLPIIPLALAASPCWRLRTWDASMIPKPFARIISIAGTPIPPPENESPDAVEATRAQTEQALNALHAAIETELGIQDTPR